MVESLDLSDKLVSVNHLQSSNSGSILSMGRDQAPATNVGLRTFDYRYGQDRNDRSFPNDRSRGRFFRTLARDFD